MTKSTVGKIATQLKQKQERVRAIDKALEMKSEYMDNLFEAVDRGCKRHKGNFFIEVSTKKEKLLDNVFRDYFADLVACPAPFWDQTVFRYNRFDGKIEYLWTLPGKNEAFWIVEHSNEIMKQPDWTGEKDLLKYVCLMVNGTLFRMMKAYNGEKENSSELIS